MLISPNIKNHQADAPPAVPPPPKSTIKFGRNKPSRSSSLRKSINVTDLDHGTTPSTNAPSAPRDPHHADGEQDTGIPVVIRPALRATKQKKRQSSSRLSFGPSALGADDDGDADISGNNGPAAPTPKKPLAKRALDTSSSLRRSASLQNLSRAGVFGGQQDRPSYSKEYLEELQSATPATPQNLSSLHIVDDDDDTSLAPQLPALDPDPDAMDLDPSELEGALVVQSSDLGITALGPAATAAAHILTETEIRERKQRRQRLAHETAPADFISLDSDDDDDNGNSNRVTVHFPSKSKKPPPRLVAEDEDLGEGYDEFVSDGGLALGRKAEREAQRRQRQEMAELINSAEAPARRRHVNAGSDTDDDDDDDDDDDSDESEAERLEAYEAAQRRAGMDGLNRLYADDTTTADHNGGGGGVNAIPAIKALPELDRVLARMRALVQGLQDDVERKRLSIADLQGQRDAIVAREKEVQEVLNQAGHKYQAVAGVSADGTRLAAQSPLRNPLLPPGIAGDLPPVERGLESFGTPTARADGDDDDEMV